MTSGTSMNTATSNRQVAVIVKYCKAISECYCAGTDGTVDHSKWNFALTSKYTTIKQGDNRITARYECVNDPASKGFSSVNVTG
jgi:hypothetical protein